jgi:hypothetical protein
MEWMRCFLQAAMQAWWGPRAPPLAFFPGCEWARWQGDRAWPQRQPTCRPTRQTNQAAVPAHCERRSPLLAAGGEGGE